MTQCRGADTRFCSVETHLDAVFTGQVTRPDESGRSRHECLRHDLAHEFSSQGPICRATSGDRSLDPADTSVCGKVIVAPFLRGAYSPSRYSEGTSSSGICLV